MFERRPTAIAQCSGVADVVAALRFARELELPTSVRGGGHGVDGRALADDALAIGLSPSTGVFVDPVARRAVVQAGARWSAVDRETQLHGLAVTGGTVSHTGVAGLTLGGGIGWLMRKHGTTADNVLSIEAVTVRGDMVRASATENPDLFWAMRGGGGNFAVATSFEFQLHQVGPTVLAGALMHPVSAASGLLRFWGDFMADAPDELMSIATLIRAPALPLFPPELQGNVIAIMQVCYIGDLIEGERLLDPLRAWGSPVADVITPQPYAIVQKTPEFMFPQTGTPGAARWYAKSGQLAELTDEVIEIVVEAAERSPVASPGRPDLPIIALWRLGGALARVERDAMAFTCSSADYIWDSTVNWQDRAEDQRWIGWECDLAASLEEHSSSNLYLNLTIDDDPSKVQSAFGARCRRLAEAKRTWDPDNVLRFNKNIAPG